MKKIIFPTILLLLQSCTFDDKGEPHIADWFWLLLVAIFVLFIVSLVNSIRNTEKTNKSLSNKGINFNNFIDCGTYIAGHPSLNDGFNSCHVLPKDCSLKLYHRPFISDMPTFKAEIPFDKIKDISIEDSSTIEKKITLGRVLLVGVFALAWKKNKKKNHAYLSIDWYDGRFNHSTLFSFEDENAMSSANKARNSLINSLPKK